MDHDVGTADSIPRAHWADTCARFSQQHRGWLAQVWAVPTAVADAAGADAEAKGHAQPRRELATGVPLHRVVLDDIAPVPAVVIHVCDEHGHEAAQPLLRIEAPRALAVEHADSGSIQGLRIDDHSGHTTYLHFRTTAPLEALNGLAETER